jgi:hypothetical protein
LPVKLLGYIKPRLNLQVNNLKVFFGVAGHMGRGRVDVGHRDGADLERQAAIADAEGEVGVVAFDGNRSFVVVYEGEDVNVCILAGVEGATKEVPYIGGKKVFLGDKAQSLRYAIMQDVIAVKSKGLKAGQQIVDQLMQRDLDVTVGGFEG